jgi:hypothetical protein
VGDGETVIVSTVTPFEFFATSETSLVASAFWPAQKRALPRCLPW